MTDIIAQGFGIIGLVVIVASFQCESNKHFFLMQGGGSLFFFLNFIIIGAYGGAFFNLANFIRGVLFLKNDKKIWKLVMVEIVYTLCLAFSFVLDSSVEQIILVLIPYVALVAMSVFMWYGNDIKIRKAQICFMSPSWIVHNIFNLSIGGLICETFNMVSSLLYLLKQNKKNN